MGTFSGGINLFPDLACLLFEDAHLFFYVPAPAAELGDFFPCEVGVGARYKNEQHSTDGLDYKWPIFCLLWAIILDTSGVCLIVFAWDWWDTRRAIVLSVFGGVGAVLLGWQLTHIGLALLGV